MPTGTLAPAAVLQVFDVNGDPLPGALLESYLSGTATPDPLFHDAGLTTAWTNPAVANAGGFFISLYMGSGAQKWILKNAAGVTQWTVDPVNAVASAAGSGAGLGEVFSFGSNSSAAITNVAYPVGSTFDFLQPGSSVFAEDSAALVGTYVLRITGMCLGGTLTVGIFSLDTGSPNTPLATASVTSTTGANATSGAIVFEAPGLSRQYGIKVLVTAGTGFLMGAYLVRTS